MKKDFLEKYLFFLRDWDNHAATIFNRSQLAYLYKEEKWKNER